MKAFSDYKEKFFIYDALEQSFAALFFLHPGFARLPKTKVEQEL